MRKYKDYHGLILQILYKEFFDYDSQYLSTAYLAYVKADKTYDENKGGAFTTYLATCVRNEVINVLRYKNALIHIPLGAREDTTITTMSFDTQYDDGLTLSEIIADATQEPDLALGDIKVPPKQMWAYNDIIEAVDSGVSEREFLKQKYGDEFHTRQTRITNLRNELKKQRHNI